MNIEELREYCISKKGVEESLPFGPQTLVFKVMGKVFLLASLDASPLQFNVKCDPDEAITLRERYDAIQPGYHMNKKHWNTVIVDGSVPAALIRKMIDDSFSFVLASLTKTERRRYELL